MDKELTTKIQTNSEPLLSVPPQDPEKKVESSQLLSKGMWLAVLNSLLFVLLDFVYKLVYIRQSQT